MAAAISLCSTLTPKLSSSQTAAPFSHTRNNLSNFLSSLTLTTRKQPSLSYTVKLTDTESAVSVSEPETDESVPENELQIEPTAEIAEPKSEDVFAVVMALGKDIRSGKKYPVVVSTWPFVEAVRAAWGAVDDGLSAIDAVVKGCSACEELRCDGTVGPGGSPDENGETTIDAMIMNGVSMEVGSVAAMRYVTNGIKAAKLVMEHTKHTMLVGEQASIFAISMGLPGPTNLSSEESIEKWMNWKKSKCQPNFRKNVLPDEDCGPYHPKGGLMGFGVGTCSNTKRDGLDECGPYIVDRHNHDTISMAVIDKMRRIAVGTSTNGATFKIPGRVGDGPIAGSSAYADADVGACGATGDGDIMMRFLPCYQVVESMRLGMEPELAAQDAISRIARKYPDFVGAVFAVDRNGSHAGACHGWTFQYSVRGPGMDDVVIYTINP